MEMNKTAPHLHTPCGTWGTLGNEHQRTDGTHYSVTSASRWAPCQVGGWARWLRRPRSPDFPGNETLATQLITQLRGAAAVCTLNGLQSQPWQRHNQGATTHHELNRQLGTTRYWVAHARAAEPCGASTHLGSPNARSGACGASTFGRNSNPTRGGIKTSGNYGVSAYIFNADTGDTLATVSAHTVVVPTTTVTDLINFDIPTSK